MILIIIYCIIQGSKGGDFKVYMGAAELLLKGKNCYNVWINLGGENYCGYSYSPFFATILIPFTFLTYPITQVLWLFANLFFLYRIFIVFKYFIDVSSFSIFQFRLWALLSFILLARFLLNNFEMVQMTIFILFCCLEAIYQLKKGNHFFSAFLISLGIIIKILPIVLIPYLIYRKQFKTIFITIFFIIIFLLFPAIFFGWEMNLKLITDWIKIINPNNSEFVAKQNYNGEEVHSLSAFVAAFFSDINSLKIPFQRTIVKLNENNLSLLLNIMRLLFISFTLYFLNSKPFTGFKNKTHTFWELSYILCIVPLIFPNQQKYAFFFIAPAVLFIIYFLILFFDKKFLLKNLNLLLIGLMILFFAITTLTSDGIIGINFSELSQYYKTITFGTIILIIVLAICNPKIIYKKNMEFENP